MFWIGSHTDSSNQTSIQHSGTPGFPFSMMLFSFRSPLSPEYTQSIHGRGLRYGVVVTHATPTRTTHHLPLTTTTTTAAAAAAAAATSKRKGGKKRGDKLEASFAMTGLSRGRDRCFPVGRAVLQKPSRPETATSGLLGCQ